MKFNVPLNNFSSGEWSPKMVSRTDTEQYARACSSLKNFIVQLQGGAFKRAGTKFIDVGTPYDGYLEATGARLVPISLSDGTNYVLVCNGERPETGTNPWFIYNVASGAKSLIDASIVTTFADAPDALFSSAQFKQVGDTLFIASPGCFPRYLKLEGGAWNLRYTSEFFAPLVITSFPAMASPYGPIQSLGINGTITATGTFTVGGSVTLTSTEDQFFAGMESDSDPAVRRRGAHFKFTEAGNTGVAEITAITNSKTATAAVRIQLPGSSPEVYGAAAGTAFEKSLWNGYDGFPRTIEAYQGRLYFGGNTNYPDYLWGSRIGNVFNMMEVPLAQDPAFTDFADDNARPFTLVPTAAGGSNIQALSASKTLLVNTQKAEIVAYGTQGALGPLDFNFDSSTSFGSERVAPARVNNYLVFVQRGFRKLRDFIFNFQEDQYKAFDLSFVADHLTSEEEIVQLVPSEIGTSVLFCRTFKGKVLALALDRDYQVTAWAPIVFGGAYSGINGTYVECLSVCAVPGGSQGRDRVFFLLRRTIDGSTAVYLEELSQVHDFPAYDGTVYPFPKYVDSWKQVDEGTPTVTFSGFDHLEGQTVSVLADGFDVGNHVVTSGDITLDEEASSVVAGLRYEAVLRPMPIEQGAQTGSSVGRDKRVHEVFLRFYRTIGCTYGLVGSTAYAVAFRAPDLAANILTPLFTGDKSLKMPQGYARTYELEVVSDSPYPCNVLAISMQGATYD